MEGRSALLAPLFVSLLLAGCANTGGGNKLVRGSEGISALPPTGGPAVPPEPVPEVRTVSRKEAPGKKPEPMRDPRPGTLVELGQIAEKEALLKKSKEAPEAFIKKLDTAREYYQRALKGDPTFLKAQEGLVRVYTQLGEHHRAQDVLRKALEKNPEEARLWLELGMTYNRQKNFNEGLKHIRKAREIDPENREFMKVMGYTLARVGKVQEGLEHLIPALGEAGAHYNMAGILRQQGNMDGAQQHLQICLRLDAGHEKARTMLDGLRGGPAPGTVPASTVPASAGPASVPAPSPAAAPELLPPALGFAPGL